jgi:hypothetical protein
MRQKTTPLYHEKVSRVGASAVINGPSNFGLLDFIVLTKQGAISLALSPFRTPPLARIYESVLFSALIGLALF